MTDGEEERYTGSLQPQKYLYKTLKQRGGRGERLGNSRVPKFTVPRREFRVETAGMKGCRV